MFRITKAGPLDAEYKRLINKLRFFDKKFLRKLDKRRLKVYLFCYLFSHFVQRARTAVVIVFGEVRDYLMER